MSMNYVKGSERPLSRVLVGTGIAFGVFFGGACTTVTASSSSPPPPRQGYTVHANVTTNPRFERETGVTWHDQLDYGELPIRTDVVIFYAHRLGDFPREGPQEVAQDPEWMDRHLTRIRRHVPLQIPDPNFSGIAVIDYEHWNVQWDRASEENQDRWRDHISQTRPGFYSLSADAQEQLLRVTYDAAARDFYLATINECRELRPNARWGFWSYPKPMPAPGAGMSDGDDRLSIDDVRDLNDELEWLWNAVDVLLPHINARWYTRPDGESINRRHGENTESENHERIMNHVGEAVRLAGGTKEVYAYFWVRYVDSNLQRRGGRARQLVNDINLRQGLTVPKAAGANGVIIWEGIRSHKVFSEFQSLIQTRLAPIVDQVLDSGGSTSSLDAFRPPAESGAARPNLPTVIGARHASATHVARRREAGLPRFSHEAINRALDRARHERRD